MVPISSAIDEYCLRPNFSHPLMKAVKSFLVQSAKPYKREERKRKERKEKRRKKKKKEKRRKKKEKRKKKNRRWET